MKLDHVVFLYTFLIFQKVYSANFKQLDLTLTANAVGEDVVDAVIEKIRFFLNQPSDYNFLRRIAAVESDFGRLEGVNEGNQEGGIWQINVGIHNSLMLYNSYEDVALLVRKVESIFGLTCFLCSETSYDIPMYSGLAAFFYIRIKFADGNIPGSLIDQARWWSQEYHEGGGSAQDYIDAVNNTEDDSRFAICKASLHMDMWILVDGSVNVSDSAFQNIKEFSINLKKTFETSSNVRFGWSVYSFANDVVIKLDDVQSNFVQAVSSATRPRGRAETGHALESVLGMLISQRRKSEKNIVLTTLMVVTDGNTKDDVEKPAAALHENEIVTFAIGIDDGNFSTLQSISSPPSYIYTYALAQYSDLTSFFEHEIVRVLCLTPVPVKNNIGNINATLIPGANQHIKYDFPSDKNLDLQLTADVMGAGRSVYLSAIIPHPNQAFYDVTFYLHKGFIEISIKAEDLKNEHGWVLPPLNDTTASITVYMTVIASPEQVSKVQLRSSTYSSSEKLKLVTEENPIIFIVLIACVSVFGVCLATLFGVRYYVSSSRHRKKVYEKESHRNVNDVLKTLTALQKMTEIVKLPDANLPSMIQLEDQLNAAEEMDVPKNRLSESYKALDSLKKNIDTLRADLQQVTKEGLQPTACYHTMVKLESLIEKGEQLDLSASELLQARAVYHKLKYMIDPIASKLKEYTKKANCPSANVVDLTLLQEKIERASELAFPVALLYEARDVHEHLKNRVEHVRNRLMELTKEVLEGNPRPDCANILDEEIAIAEVMHISKEIVNPARDALSKLRKDCEEVKLELLKNTETAFQPSAPLKTIENLKSSICLAEQFNISINFLKEPKDALKLLESRLDEIRELLSSSAKAAEQPTSGFFELNKLENIIILAENTQFPAEQLKPFKEIHDRIKIHLQPIADSLKKACNDAKCPSANVHTMMKLEERIYFVQKFNISQDQLEEPKRVLSNLRHIHETINQVKADLVAALNTSKLHVLTPILNIIRKNQKQIQAWNPNDKDFVFTFEKALVIEKSMLDSLEEMYQAKLNKLNPREKLEVLIDDRDIDRLELRKIIQDFEIFCGSNISNEDRKLKKEANQVFNDKTIQFAVNVLETAIPSHEPKMVAAALEKAEHILQHDLFDNGASKDPRIVAACKRAEDALASAYALERNAKEKINAHKVELRNQIKSALNSDKNSLMDAVKIFENELGYDVTTEDTEILNLARRTIAEKIKQELSEYFQKGLKTHEIYDLKFALTRLDESLTKELKQCDVDNDEQFEKLVKTVRTIYFNTLEFERTMKSVLSFQSGSILESIKDEKAPLIVLRTITFFLFLLDTGITLESERENIKETLENLGDEKLKELVLKTNASNVNVGRAQKIKELMLNLDLNQLENYSETAAILFSWTSCLLKQMDLELSENQKQEKENQTDSINKNSNTEINQMTNN